MKILKIPFPVFFIFVLLTAGTLYADCIVLFCKPSASFKIFRQIHLRVSVFLTVVSIHPAAQDSGVTFKDVTKRAGIDFRYTFGDHHYENILESSGSGVTVFDYNNDGRLDLMVGNFLAFDPAKLGELYMGRLSY